MRKDQSCKQQEAATEGRQDSNASSNSTQHATLGAQEAGSRDQYLRWATLEQAPCDQ